MASLVEGLLPLLRAGPTYLRGGALCIPTPKQTRGVQAPSMAWTA